MDLGLHGKVAMVAASSKGIGFATAKMLAQEGCRISICARNEEALEAAAGHIGEETRSYVVDVANPDDLRWWVDQTREDLGPIDIVVTNTGGPPAGALDQITDEQWAQGFEGTLMNIIRLVRLSQADMIASKWGRFVHITSLVAKEPSALLPISSTLRTGVMSLTKLQALKLAKYGITVNSVLPGHTMTDRQTHLADIRASQQGISQEEALRRQAESMPMGRMADPDEIAAAVVFLCSAQASYVSGVSLLVDGAATVGFG